MRVWLWVLPLFSMCAFGVVENFSALLVRAQLEFFRPAGFIGIVAEVDGPIDFHQALASEDRLLEVFIAIRPRSDLQIDYDDAHGSVPNPDHVFPLIFQSLVTRLGGASYAPSANYSAEEARQRFNADWAAVAVFDNKNGLGSDFKQGLLLTIHRDAVADAYIILLFDDYESVRSLVKESLQMLIFTDEAESV